MLDISILFLWELCWLIACANLFVVCSGLNTQTPARVNESNSIPPVSNCIHPRIKKDSPPYTFPYACDRLARLRSTTPRQHASGFLSESNRKDNDKL